MINFSASWKLSHTTYHLQFILTASLTFVREGNLNFPLSNYYTFINFNFFLLWSTGSFLISCWTAPILTMLPFEWSNASARPEQEELLTCIGIDDPWVGKNLAFTVYWFSLKVHYVIVQGLEKHNSLNKPCSFLWDLSLGQTGE